MISQPDLLPKTVGEASVPSPLGLSQVRGQGVPHYVQDNTRIALDIEWSEGQTLPPTYGFEKAGPREKIFFDPMRARVGIVTCGGLCPGINNVVRSMVLELHHKYRVREVMGFRYGFEGLNPATGLVPMRLTPQEVGDVHRLGGSFLGLSRGKQDPKVMVDTMMVHGINVLFVIGGDGTLRGAHAIYEEVSRRGRPLAVVCVPKTIDNDIPYVDKSFGFDTAVEIARDAVDAAHTEARGARNGIGVVKLMGRDSGFIAAAATLASMEVNFCLVPEVPFDVAGPHGLLSALERRVLERGHALVVVAEGCAASLMSENEVERDASGNIRYASASADVGPRLRDAIAGHFQARGVPTNVKYIDPSYMIRGLPANASDSVFCDALARNAVHAGMAGKTDIVVGSWYRTFTHVPLPYATSGKKRIDAELWRAVCETTGQPVLVPEPQ